MTNHMTVTRIHPDRASPPPQRCRREHVIPNARIDGHLHIVTTIGVYCALEAAGHTGICAGDDDPNAERIQP